MSGIRLILPGRKPQMCSFDASTAGDVITKMLGGSGVAGDHSISVNGVGGSSSSPVKPGDTVQVQPRARNG